MQNSNMGEKIRITDRVNFKHKKKAKNLQKICKNIEFRIASDYFVHTQQNLIALDHFIQFLYIVICNKHQIIIKISIFFYK